MADKAETTPTTGWRVVSQIEQTQIGPTGVLEKGVLVTFQLDGGTQGSVFVPEARYTVAAVRDAIAQKAAVLHAVNQITS